MTISTESASNRICVIATDNTGASSTNICSDAYKLDKTAPVIGTSNMSVIINGSVNLTSGVSVSDTLSGVVGSYSYNPTSVSTGSIGTTNVSYQATDQAGNIGTAIRLITVTGYVFQKYDCFSQDVFSWKQYTVNTTYQYKAVAGSTTTIQSTETTYRFTDSFTISTGKFVPSNINSTSMAYYVNSTAHITYPYLIISDTSYGEFISSSKDDFDRYSGEFQVYNIRYVGTDTIGTYQKDVTSSISNTYPANGKSGSNWYVYDKVVTVYSKGTTNYGTVTAASSSAYPTNGRHTDGYWYVRI